MNSLSRPLAILEKAFVLFACSAFVGSFIVWKANPGKPLAYVLALGSPLFAVGVALIAMSSIRDLVPNSKSGFPSNITLPIVYTTFLLLGQVIFYTTPTALTTIPPILQYGLIWRDPVPLIISGVMQFVILSLIGLAKQ